MSYNGSDAGAAAGWIIIGTVVGVFCAIVGALARRFRIVRRVTVAMDRAAEAANGEPVRR